MNNARYTPDNSVAAVSSSFADDSHHSYDGDNNGSKCNGTDLVL